MSLMVALSLRAVIRHVLKENILRVSSDNVSNVVYDIIKNSGRPS
jgi:hypothetical protein